jgi:hypothetical protein
VSGGAGPGSGGPSGGPSGPGGPRPTKAPPGKGLFGWLGRQIGHVSKAIYRESRVEEQPHPADPNVVLRRTVIDEAVVRPSDPK